MFDMYSFQTFLIWRILQAEQEETRRLLNEKVQRERKRGRGRERERGGELERE
jgi:hypothetical protein